MTDSYAAAIISLQLVENDLQRRISSLERWRHEVVLTMDEPNEATVKLREDLNKTTQASILENLAVTRINELVGLQAVQIRDLVRQVGDLEGRLNRHLDNMGYSE